MSLIHATNIHRVFHTGTVALHVLKGISLTVEKGEFVAIMGKSGAGKSTLLYQLSTLDRPTTGDIRINDIDILTLSEDELSDFRLHTLGYVFQDYALVPELTVTENVLLPLLMRGHIWEEAIVTAHSALDAVGLQNKKNTSISHLSGGEQQRVSVARAVAIRPKIIFADEPTANLDSSSGRAIIELFAELNRAGHTIVMVTHEAEYANACDRIINVEDGLIISDTKQVPQRIAPPIPTSPTQTTPYKLTNTGITPLTPPTPTV